LILGDIICQQRSAELLSVPLGRPQAVLTAAQSKPSSFVLMPHLGYFIGAVQRMEPGARTGEGWRVPDVVQP